MSYSVEERGNPYSFDYRIFFSKLECTVYFIMVVLHYGEVLKCFRVSYYTEYCILKSEIIHYCRVCRYQLCV